MSRNRLSYWLVLGVALLWGCRKDVDEFRPYPPSAQEINDLLAAEIPSSASNFIFSLSHLSEDRVLEMPSGTRIFLIDTDNLFEYASNGNIVLASTCPDLKIEVTEVLAKRDLVARGLHTAGEGGSLFESGGMVKITASCNGQALVLRQNRSLKIQIPHSAPESDFFVFSRNAEAAAGEFWASTGQEVFEAEWPVGNGGVKKGYELLLKNLGWAACGRTLAGDTSPFCVTLPSGFGEQNTLCYLIFKDNQVVAPLQFNLGKNNFCYPHAPIGFQVQMVSVSKLGQQFWLGKAQTEIGTNATFPLGNQQMTETAVLNFIKSL